MADYMMIIAILLSVAVFPSTASSAQTIRSQAKELKAGAALRVVNPTKPAATIGHRVMKLFSNVYCDIRVQAVVLEDSLGKRVVWLGYDFCVPPWPVVDRIKRQIQQRHGIPPEAVCINASHTHSAPPLSRWEAAIDEHFDADYAERVVCQAVAVVGDAIGRLVPARLRYVEDACRLGINRRLGPPGKIRFGPNPEGAVDHRVQAIAVESASDGRLLCVVVKYACHPVTVVNAGLGSDYPGYMRQAVEKRHPGAVAVFLQGCGANVDSQVGSSPERLLKNSVGFGREMAAEALKSDRPLEKLAESFGGELAAGVERALSKRGTPVSGPIESEYKVIDLPIQEVPAKRYAEAAKRDDKFSGQWGRMYTEMLKRGEKIPKTWPYRIQAFRMGAAPNPLTLVALDGEVFCEYGLNIGRMLQPADTIVLGYSNGVVTYVPTAKGLDEGGYEAEAYRFFRLPGPYSKDAEKILLEAALKLARSEMGTAHGRLLADKVKNRSASSGKSAGSTSGNLVHKDVMEPAYETFAH